MTDKRQVGPRSLVTHIAHRLRARPDSEHEMRFNALGFGIAILIYLLATTGNDSSILAVPPAYLAINIAVLGHILLYPGICRPRRIFSILSDLGALFCVMQIGGETTAVLVPLYFWVILGNGFRFGTAFLALATAAGVVSFGAMVATTPFWSAHGALTAGLFGGMLLVPLGIMPLIRKLSGDKRKAEAEDREKERLLVGMSHELRTPLSDIIGTGSTLQDTRLSPTQRELARRVVSAGRRLLELVDDIPDSARPGRPGRGGDR
jgi:two-component system sensor histidine kinase RpfC